MFINLFPFGGPWIWRHISDFYNMDSLFCLLIIREVPLYLTRLGVLGV